MFGRIYTKIESQSRTHLDKLIFSAPTRRSKEKRRGEISITSLDLVRSLFFVVSCEMSSKRHKKRMKNRGLQALFFSIVDALKIERIWDVVIYNSRRSAVEMKT